jgi:hypothetical protein
VIAVSDLFTRPVSPLDRIRQAQVCPHCFAQVFTVWGQDLRVRSRCPDCHRRLFLVRGAVHSARSAAGLHLGIFAVLVFGLATVFLV